MILDENVGNSVTQYNARMCTITVRVSYKNL